MAGGIQPGTVACDEAARNHDNLLKNVSEILQNELKQYGVVMQKKLRKDQIPGNIGACAPDGGAWFYKGKLIAVFEAKKQGLAGNAIERWFKNNFICRKINTDVSYVTYCIGEGANHVMTSTLNIAHLEGFDKYNPGSNSCFRSTNGFDSSEIYKSMSSVLMERIEHENK